MQWTHQGVIKLACASLPPPCRAAELHRQTTWKGRIDVLTLWRQNALMSAPKRATVYFDADVHRALRLRAAANERSMSDMVNDAVKVALAEDAADLEAFDQRRKERSTPFESFVRGMKRRGRL